MFIKWLVWDVLRDKEELGLIYLPLLFILSKRLVSGSKVNPCLMKLAFIPAQILLLSLERLQGYKLNSEPVSYLMFTRYIIDRKLRLRRIIWLLEATQFLWQTWDSHKGNMTTEPMSHTVKNCLPSIEWVHTWTNPKPVVSFTIFAVDVH